MTGDEFRELRKRLGLSQAELGERIGRTRFYVYRLESHPEPEKIAVLALKQVAQEAGAPALS